MADAGSGLTTGAGSGSGADRRVRRSNGGTDGSVVDGGASSAVDYKAVRAMDTQQGEGVAVPGGTDPPGGTDWKATGAAPPLTEFLLQLHGAEEGPAGPVGNETAGVRQEGNVQPEGARPALQASDSAGGQEEAAQLQQPEGQEGRREEEAGELEGQLQECRVVAPLFPLRPPSALPRRRDSSGIRLSTPRDGGGHAGHAAETTDSLIDWTRCHHRRRQQQQQQQQVAHGSYTSSAVSAVTNSDVLHKLDETLGGGGRGGMISPVGVTAPSALAQSRSAGAQRRVTYSGTGTSFQGYQVSAHAGDDERRGRAGIVPGQASGEKSLAAAVDATGPTSRTMLPASGAAICRLGRARLSESGTPSSSSSAVRWQRQHLPMVLVAAAGTGSAKDDGGLRGGAKSAGLPRVRFAPWN